MALKTPCLHTGWVICPDLFPGWGNHAPNSTTVNWDYRMTRLCDVQGSSQAEDVIEALRGIGIEASANFPDPTDAAPETVELVYIPIHVTRTDDLPMAQRLLRHALSVTRLDGMDDVPTCRDCGYDLRGHSGDGECPECGYPYRTGEAAREPDTACPQCASLIPASFDTCWNCGASTDGTVDPSFEPAVAVPTNSSNDEGSQAEARPDTIPDPETRDASSEERERRRQVWFCNWCVSWVGMMTWVVFLTTSYEPGRWSDMAEVVFVLLVISNFIFAVASPIGFVLAMLSR